jgi:starvation-inducible DNA-binding protein
VERYKYKYNRRLGERLMEELVDKVKQALADSFAFALKAQSYHWNVIGSDFPQLHDFFGELYTEVRSAVDTIAEQIRQLDAFAPGTLERMKELSSVEEDEKIPVALKMVENLIAANETVMNTMTEAYKMAEEQEQYALSNFLQDRLTAHSKHRWMLKATAGRKS